MSNNKLYNAIIICYIYDSDSMKIIRIVTIILLFLVTSLLLVFYRTDKTVPKSNPEVLNKKTSFISCIVLAINDDLVECEDDIIYSLELDNVQVGDIISLEYGDPVFAGNFIQLKKEDSYNYINKNGIFKDYYKAANELLSKMNLDEKIGQLFLVRVPATKKIDDLKKYHFGGYLLFRRDFRNKTKQEVIDNIKSYQENSTIPLLVASDEEGGDVSRVSINSNIVSQPFKSPRTLYQEGGLALIEKDNINKNKLLMSLGINLNLAPVLDISTNPQDYIYKRSLGQDKYIIGDFAKAIIKTSKESSVSNTLKHFPGYGENVDTHQGLSYDNRSIDHILNEDLVPFKMGIEGGAESILVSHNIIVNIDNNLPASLSYKVHNILRKDLAFTGVVITDDLSMGAIINNYQKDAIINAINNGNDLLIVTDYNTAINNVKNALKEGLISENILTKRALKILAWKYYKGLINP